MTELTKKRNGKMILIVIAYFTMIIFGLLEALKGAVIPAIRSEFSVDYSHIGQMLFIALLGYLIATFFAGLAAEKYGLKKLAIFGILIVAISSAGFNFMSNFYGVVATYFILGIGLGAFEIVVNVLGGKIFVKNQALMMNLVHLFFGIGATVAPRYAGAFIDKGYSWKYSYLLTVAFTVLLLILVLFAKFPPPNSQGAKQKNSFKEVAKSSRVWLIAMTLGLLIAMESGIFNWLVNYLQEARSLSVIKSTSYSTYFFALFTLGRLIGGYFADRIGFIKSLIYFTITASVLLLLGTILDDRFIWMFSLTGFFVSIMFPTVMAIIMTEFKVGTGTVMGFVITVNGVINMSSGWVLGLINDYFGVNAGMISIVLFGAAATVLLIVLKATSVRLPEGEN